VKLPRLITIAGSVCVVLLLAIAFSSSVVAYSPLDAARASAVGHGRRLEDLSVVGFQTANGVIGGTAHVDLNAKGSDGPAVIRIDLVRPVYSAKWRVSGYHDGTSKRQ